MGSIVVSLPCTAYLCAAIKVSRASLPGGKITVFKSINLYLKYQPTHIFTGTQLLPQGNVLICNTQGQIEAIVPATEAGSDVQQLQGILSPGFVNAHCHIELSHCRELIPQHTGLVNFVQQVMQKRHPFTTEQIMAAQQAAAEELYQSGTVAVADICNTDNSIALKQQSPMYWHSFVETSGFVNATASTRMADALELLRLFNTLPAQKHRAGIVPHAPYSVSPALFGLINEASALQLISIHNQECPAEDQLYKNKTGEMLRLYQNLGIDISAFEPTGKSSLQSWLPYFTHNQKIISVHNSFTGPEDIAFAQNKIYYCICINANLYIENSLPPIDLLLQQHCPIVIGTDSYASNQQLNIMAEINSIRGHFPHIALEQVLQWATLNGAEALGIAHEYGSFEKGKKPGLVIIRQNEASTLESFRMNTG